MNQLLVGFTILGSSYSMDNSRFLISLPFSGKRFNMSYVTFEKEIVRIERNIISNEKGCIELKVLGYFGILLKSNVIQSKILKTLSKSSVIQYVICAKSLKFTYNPLLFN